MPIWNLVVREKMQTLYTVTVEAPDPETAERAVETHLECATMATMPGAKVAPWEEPEVLEYEIEDTWTDDSLATA